MILDMEILPIWSSDGGRGLKVVIKTDNGVYSASAPSPRIHEKWEPPILEVRKAVKKFHDIKKEFINSDERDFDITDDKLEKLGSKNIGSNLAIAISKACIKAGGKGDAYKLMNPEAKKFPMIMMPVMSGGKSGGYCSIQRFFIIPRAPKSPQDAVTTCISFWSKIGELLRQRGMILGRNQEGSWIPHLTDIKAIELLKHYADQNNIALGLDFCASNLYRNGKYQYPKIGGSFNPGEQLEFVKELVKKYHISYIEDPFHPNDFRGLSELTKRLKGTFIAGDDTFSSQPQRVKKGIRDKAGNSFIVKLGRTGTVSKAMRLVDTAKENNFIPIVSDRLVETNDDFIADLAVATEVPLMKCGMSGGERLSKLNRLMEIWFDISAQKTPEMSVLRV